jgi:hydroxymethylbilane synthase
MQTLRLGTRKSALAQAQANWTAGALRTAFPDLKVEIILITTSGDVLSSSPAVTGRGSMDSPPSAAGNDAIARPSNLKALFTKEIEEALLDNRIDLAVHSLKDMSAELPKGLIIGAVPEREDPRDVWISKNKQAFRNLPAGIRIGTGSVRRQAQLKRLHPSAKLIAIRGNVDTRLRKLADGELEGIVLALAGLKRLGHEKVVTEILPIETILPAVGQGCLGIQIRDRDKVLLPFIKALDHPASHVAALCERAFLKTLGGSCQTPIAGHASIQSGELTLYGLVTSPDGQLVVNAKENGRPFDAEGIGVRLAQKLLAEGADKILATLN